MLRLIIPSSKATSETRLPTYRTGGHTASSHCTVVQPFMISLLHQVTFSKFVLLHGS